LEQTVTDQDTLSVRRHGGRFIHREGRPLIRICGTALLLTTVAVRKYRGATAARGLLAGSLTVLGFLIQFFRHPGCTTPVEADLVVAPASGRVVHIGLEEEPEMLGDRRVRISVFLSIFDAHLTRSPIAGRVLDQRYHPGRYLVALHPKSSTLNERNSILLEHPGGPRVLVRQIAGFLARRICSYVVAGESVEAGAEIGFIKLGSRVDLFLPVGTTVLVHPGGRVRAGETPLARLVTADATPMPSECLP
jgi:phosphatidylserine decarboxylase